MLKVKYKKSILTVCLVLGLLIRPKAFFVQHFQLELFFPYLITVTGIATKGHPTLSQVGFESSATLGIGHKALALVHQKESRFLTDFVDSP